MIVRINDNIEATVKALGGVLFSAFIVITLFQVFVRNFISMSFVWTDEVAMFCFIWSVFLGATIGYRHGVHYVVEIFPEHFVRTNIVLRLVALALGFPLIWVLTTSGFEYAQMGWRRYSFSLGFPLFYQNIAVAISGAVMMLFTLELTLKCLKDLGVMKRSDDQIDGRGDAQ